MAFDVHFDARLDLAASLAADFCRHGFKAYFSRCFTSCHLTFYLHASCKNATDFLEAYGRTGRFCFEGPWS